MLQYLTKNLHETLAVWLRALPCIPPVAFSLTCQCAREVNNQNVLHPKSSEVEWKKTQPNCLHLKDLKHHIPPPWGFHQVKTCMTERNNGTFLPEVLTRRPNSCSLDTTDTVANECRNKCTKNQLTQRNTGEHQWKLISFYKKKRTKLLTPCSIPEWEESCIFLPLPGCTKPQFIIKKVPSFSLKLIFPIYFPKFENAHPCVFPVNFLVLFSRIVFLYWTQKKYNQQSATRSSKIAWRWLGKGHSLLSKESVPPPQISTLSSQIPTPPHGSHHFTQPSRHPIWIVDPLPPSRVC